MLRFTQTSSAKDFGEENFLTSKPRRLRDLINAPALLVLPGCTKKGFNMYLCARDFWLRGMLRYRSYSIRLLASTLAFAFIGTATVIAQEYPVRAIKIVVASPPGGGTDILGRLIAERLVAKWGQPAFVENRGGNAGNIGAEAVSKSAPDGYTILLVAQGALGAVDIQYFMGGGC